jgi:hypothetical protein
MSGAVVVVNSADVLIETRQERHLLEANLQDLLRSTLRC